MIDATVANFETEVVEASHTVPVLVDLWAPWCGPCRALGPILEKLEVAYEGRFKLVKINTEEEQELAAAFGVRSIPMVMLLKDGQPVDGFVGALPEGQIREFLDKHVPDTAPEQADEAEPSDAEAASAPALPPLEKLQQDLATNPANDNARKAYVELLLKDGRTADAKLAFEPIAGKALADARIQALADWLCAAQAAPACPLLPRCSPASPPTSATSTPATPWLSNTWLRSSGPRRWTNCSTFSCATKAGAKTARARPLSTSSN